VDVGAKISSSRIQQLKNHLKRTSDVRVTTRKRRETVNGSVLVRTHYCSCGSGYCSNRVYDLNSITRWNWILDRVFNLNPFRMQQQHSRRSSSNRETSGEERPGSRWIVGEGKPGLDEGGVVVAPTWRGQQGHRIWAIWRRGRVDSGD